MVFALEGKRVYMVIISLDRDQPVSEASISEVGWDYVGLF